MKFKKLLCLVALFTVFATPAFADDGCDCGAPVCEERCDCSK